MYLGVDYYPEHWDKSMIDEDMQRIRAMGANTIRIGEFAWHMMESEEGCFDFSFFDYVIEKARKYCLYIIFGTPTATFPAWLYKKHPSILSVDINGNTRAFGGRRQYCFNSDIYSKYSLKLVEKLVNHYKEEALIIAWQIDNELGHEGSDMCYCEACHQGFQEFLKEKYINVNALNKAYGTIFWGQSYNDFNEIPIPVKTITSHNPAFLLDWARFRSKTISTFAKKQIDVVRNNKGEHQIITTNFFGNHFNLAYNQNEISKELDIVSFDNYPVWGGLEKPNPPAYIAMNHDYTRGLKEQNYWIVEELMGAQGHTEIGYLPRPEEAKLWAYQAVAKGCEALLFFRWRSMTRGAEQFCQGILDADNKDNRKLREVSAFFKDIVKYEEVFKSKIHSEAAFIYDFDNCWSWHYQPQSKSFDYTNEFLRVYKAFHSYNTSIDIIEGAKDFSNYKVIVLPVMQIIDESLNNRLKAFAEAGGTIIFTFRTAIKDRHNNTILGEKTPCFVNDLCGLEIVEYEALGNCGNVTLEGCGSYLGTYSGKVWRDLIVPTTAQTLMKYIDEFYSQYSAVTVNTYGKGKVYYIGCGLDSEGISSIVKNVIIEKHLAYTEAPEGVEVIYRGTDKNKYKIILNHNCKALTFEEVELKPYEVRIEKVRE